MRAPLAPFVLFCTGVNDNSFVLSVLARIKVIRETLNRFSFVTANSITMEDMNTDNDETVTLVLRGNRIQANKVKLSRYSLYFASLFSENYNDHRQEEFTINYEMSLSTLQDFVHWANNEGEHTRVVHSPKYYCVVRASLEKFLTGSYGQLLELLELSVVFLAEKLTENIIEMIICMRLPPDNMLEIWLLAENLGLKVLRDVALATCLDRFEELPVSSLVELSIEHFSKLVLNVNVRSSPARLLVVREEWKKRNGVFTDLPDAFSQFLNYDSDDIEPVLEQKKPRYIQCVAGLKANRDLSIYAWNSKTLQEIAEMSDSQMHTTFDNNGKDIVGRQVIGRGFSIYLIGGEQGIGTGRFNPALWRYCLFSKKWYIETLFPRPRRHMAVAFIENKLYLFGGVGRNRLKLSKVDVFNVHTGLWSKAAHIPEDFTEVPASCVVNNKFVYYKSNYYIYDPRTDQWSSISVSSEGTSLLNDYQIPIRSLIGYRNEDGKKPVLFLADVVPSRRTTLLRRLVLETSGTMVHTKIIQQWSSEHDVDSTFYQQIMNGQSLVSFAYSDERISVEIGEVRVNESAQATEKSNQVPEETYRRLKTYSKAVKNVPWNFLHLRLGCFNLIDPKSLHMIIALPKQECINV